MPITRFPAGHSSNPFISVPVQLLRDAEKRNRGLITSEPRAYSYSRRTYLRLYRLLLCPFSHYHKITYFMNKELPGQRTLQDMVHFIFLFNLFIYSNPSIRSTLPFPCLVACPEALFHALAFPHQFIRRPPFPSAFAAPGLSARDFLSWLPSSPPPLQTPSSLCPGQSSEVLGHCPNQTVSGEGCCRCPKDRR